MLISMPTGNSTIFGAFQDILLLRVIHSRASQLPLSAHPNKQAASSADRLKEVSAALQCNVRFRKMGRTQER
jgi:hypothetical protein